MNPFLAECLMALAGLAATFGGLVFVLAVVSAPGFQIDDDWLDWLDRTDAEIAWIDATKEIRAGDA